MGASGSHCKSRQQTMWTTHQTGCLAVSWRMCRAALHIIIPQHPPSPQEAVGCRPNNFVTLADVVDMHLKMLPFFGTRIPQQLQPKS